MATTACFALAQIGRGHFSGLVAWLMGLVIHLVFLVGLRNRLAVFIQWIYAYFTCRRGARIIMGEGGPSGLQNPLIVILSRAKDPTAGANPAGSFARLRMTDGGNAG